MSFTEMLPELHNLSRQDKLKLIGFLAQDLARDEKDIIEPNRAYPVWSPNEAFSAAATLLEVLEEEKGR